MTPALGIGCVYWPALDPLLRRAGSPASVVEIEPQTFWELVRDADRGWHYRPNEALLDGVASLPQVKLLHGVGHPVGGRVVDPVEHLGPLAREVRRFDPPWISEHLSLNRFLPEGEGGDVEHAGFLLPPGQDAAHARIAAARLQGLSHALGRPAAFETGVNYLRPVPGAMSDGEFFASVAQASGGGILLDLHNLWCNECNGRQPARDVIAALPHDRIWEIHLAGGQDAWGYRLDAHSGVVPAQVLELAAEWIPRLPALGAIIFELLPEHIASVGVEGVERQLEALKTLWALRPASRHRVTSPRWTRGAVAPAAAMDDDLDAVGRCESRLRNDLRRLAANGVCLAEGDDPGLGVLAHLVRDFRRGSLARTLRLTLTLLLQGLGSTEVEALIDAYLGGVPPQPFPALEADAFAHWMAARWSTLPRLPHLAEVLAFESALVRATVHGEATDLRWSVDPGRLLTALDAGQVPPALPPVSVAVRIEVGA